jgi:ribosome-associated heat shock protein Hsp15
MAECSDAIVTQRLDKWLWHARIIKTRSLAAQLVSNGKFRVNREKIAKPAHTVKHGDVITTSLFGKVRVLQVTGFADRRGPASEAQTLYDDITPEAPPEDASTAPVYDWPKRRARRTARR